MFFSSRATSSSPSKGKTCLSIFPRSRNKNNNNHREVINRFVQTTPGWTVRGRELRLPASTSTRRHSRPKPMTSITLASVREPSASAMATFASAAEASASAREAPTLTSYPAKLSHRRSSRRRRKSPQPPLQPHFTKRLLSPPPILPPPAHPSRSSFPPPTQPWMTAPASGPRISPAPPAPPSRDFRRPKIFQVRYGSSAFGWLLL